MPVVPYPAVSCVPLRGEDSVWLAELLADPRIAWYEPLAVPPGTPAAARFVDAYIRRSAHPTATTHAWMVVERGRRVGVCQLRRAGEGYLVGVSLSAGVRGRGLGTALFRSLADFGVRTRRGSFVAGEVEDDNVASLRAIQRASYGPTGRYSTTLDNGRLTIVTRFVAG